MENMDQQLGEGLERLEHIEENLEEIKKRTPDQWLSFRNGVLQGAGAVIGGIVAILLLGWALSIFGLIPGLNVIAHNVQNAMLQLRK